MENIVTEPVFLPKKRNPVVGFNIANIFNKRLVKGDIGIEIEVEGNKFQKEDIPAPWSYHKDGSLRGHDNAEYVLKQPITFEAVPKAIERLWQMFSSYGSQLDVSNRTSVHVHLNAQKWHLDRLTNFVALYFSIEEILTQWCGEHRVGNLFCLRAKDATAIVTKIKKFIQSDGSYELPDGLHYAGLNANALYKFGSLEIRTLRGCTDPQTILDWIAILERLYNLSADFKDPRDLPVKFSSEGPIAYLDMLLGDKRHMVLDAIGYDSKKAKDALYEGIRLAQDLCYCRDWSLYKPTDTREDPFGRDAKKVAIQLAAMEAHNQAGTEIMTYETPMSHYLNTIHNVGSINPFTTNTLPTPMVSVAPADDAPQQMHNEAPTDPSYLSDAEFQAFLEEVNGADLDDFEPDHLAE